MDRVDKVRRKVRELNRQRKNGLEVCFRCGASDHLAAACRNPICCFACGRTGHRARSCSLLASCRSDLSENDDNARAEKMQDYLTPSKRS